MIYQPVPGSDETDNNLLSFPISEVNEGGIVRIENDKLNLAKYE